MLFAPTATVVKKSGSNDALTTKDRLFVGAASPRISGTSAMPRSILACAGITTARGAPSAAAALYLRSAGGPRSDFPEQTYFVWDKVVPRLGLVYDLSGNGKTVVKVNYGLYPFDPGISLGGNGNPNQLQKSVTYSWTDNKACPGCVANDRIYQPGEEGGQTASSLANNIKIDPNLKQPTSTQATVISSGSWPKASPRAAVSCTTRSTIRFRPSSRTARRARIPHRSPSSIPAHNGRGAESDSTAFRTARSAISRTRRSS